MQSNWQRVVAGGACCLHSHPGDMVNIQPCAALEVNDASVTLGRLALLRFVSYSHLTPMKNSIHL